MKEEIKYSIKNLFSRKMRSALTILSILIGIAAIFSLISFGMGIQDYMNTLSEEAGSDKIMVMAKGLGVPGMDENFFLTQDDVDFISKINGVDEIIGLYIKTGEIEFNKEKAYHFVAGLDPNNQEFMDEVFTVSVEKGRNLKSGELTKVLLGYNYQFKNKNFKKEIKLGDKIYLNGERFEVVGFYQEIGNPEDDSNIYLTLSGMEKLYPDIKDKFGFIYVSTHKGEDPRKLADKIEEKLRKYKGQEEGKEDFYAQTFEDMMETYGNIINIINGILILIAFISLIVACVNIMNTMYTAIIERTKEIGIMKSIGAKNKTIVFIFMFEAGLLGAIGGILGIAFGYAVAKTGGILAANAGYSSLQPIFPWYLIVGCFLFATIMGAMAGILPAKKASKLNPVDALRYE